MEYTQFDRVVANCICHGPSCYLVKTDIQSAYWILPIHPDDWHLLGCAFGGNTSWINASHLVWHRPMPSLRYQLQAILWACLRSQALDHYLDDFIGSHHSKNGASFILHVMFDVCEELGIPLALDKTVWAMVHIRFLGLILDSVHQVVRIPQHKIASLTRKLLHV